MRTIKFTHIRFVTLGLLILALTLSFTNTGLALQQAGELQDSQEEYLSYLPMIIRNYYRGSSGLLDLEFDTDGLVLTEMGIGYNYGYAIAIQPDGKIVVAGEAAWGDFALTRYNLDGSLDTTFGDDGLVITDFSGDTDVGQAICIQPDGKIIVVGKTWGGSNYDFALARYNQDGSLDTTFGDEGLISTDFDDGYDIAYSVTLQADNKIVVAGKSSTAINNDFALARYNPNGSLDITFSDDGWVTTDFASNDEEGYAVAIQSDGKIVVAGMAYIPGNYIDFALVRYNPDGSLDSSFDADGWVTTDFTGDADYGRSIAIQQDGKIVVAGYGGFGDFALARYNSNGSLDAAFGNAGQVTTDFGATSDFGYAMVLQPDGKIVVAGTANMGSTGSDFALARYNSNGSLDTSFHYDGKVTTDFNSIYDNGCAMALQQDGKIVVAGYTSIEMSYLFAIARYK